ncbi:MAG: hypothetical protein ABIP30_01470 [Ferruginibacter sp.]
MQKPIKLAAMAILSLSVMFVSCKKTDSNPTTDPNTDLAIHADDQAQVSNENDAVLNDVNTALEANGSSLSSITAPGGAVTSGVLGTDGVNIGNICDASFTLDTLNGNKRIVITYNGTNCSGTRTRTGVVVVSIPVGQRFKDAGAALTISVQNLKITRIADGKSITINGSEVITNVSGGLLKNLASLGTITHTVESSGITITFDNSTQRSWMIAKKRVFTYDNGIVITISGTHTDGTITGISEWGTNRFGNAFVTSITQPKVIRQDCNFRLVSGQVTHQRLVATIVVTFGLDSTGNPTTCPAGVFYYKVVWTGANGIVKTFILPY